MAADGLQLLRGGERVEQAKKQSDTRYLTCEKYYIYELLILAGGMMGAYTYLLRGGVFCNAQTANVVLMALAFGQGQWKKGLYYLIPIFAYIAGSIVSEALPSGIRKQRFLRWDTWLIGFEILVLFCVGFLPLSLPAQIVQVTINFICSMQYNTFRQAEGIPMATTFVTNHIRQIGVWTVNAVKKKDSGSRSRLWKHLRMIGCFFLGGLILTVCCGALQEKAIWIAMLPLAVIFLVLIRADLFAERQMFDMKPHGH